MEGANNVNQKGSIPSASAWSSPKPPLEAILKHGHAEWPFGAGGGSLAQVKV
jgi:hypothetical protein